MRRRTLARLVNRAATHPVIRRLAMTASARVDLGFDTSGRRILLTKRMKAAFDAVCEAAGVDITIVQGAFMREAGGGASASAGYHDGAGCIDTRVWNLTVAEQDAVIREARKIGWAVWLRDHRHGMDPHMHWVLLGEPGMAPGARWQEAEYRAGRDGLATRGPDYHWRPKHIRTFDFDAHTEQEDDLMSLEVTFPDGKKRDAAKALEHMLKQQDRITKQLTAAGKRDRAVKQAIADVLRAVDRNADRAEIRQMLENLDAQIVITVNDDKE